MKVIIVQDSFKFRVTLVPETAVDDFMMHALRAADGSRTKVLPVETGEIEKVINPYRLRNGDKDESKPAVMIEMEVSNFPILVEKEDEVKPNG